LGKCERNTVTFTDQKSPIQKLVARVNQIERI
jgi:hypothetical protein